MRKKRPAEMFARVLTGASVVKSKERAFSNSIESALATTSKAFRNESNALLENFIYLLLRLVEEGAGVGSLTSCPACNSESIPVLFILAISSAETL